MCGIFGVVGQTKQAAQTVLEGLKKLEYRGYDSWGIAVKKDSRLVRERRVGKIGSAKTKLPAANIGLGHTRWATHGGVTVGNAHPHFDCSHKLCLVHNGIVENFLALKETLTNHCFKSQTDTEVALHLIEEQAKKTTTRLAVENAFKQVVGLNAFIVLDAPNNQLLAVKNGSPLIIGLGKTANYIASDVWALLDHTNQVIFLEDNHLAQITADSVKLYDLKTAQLVKPQIIALDWQAEQSRLGRFHHYMEKEIFDQPKVLDNLSRLEANTIASAAQAIKTARRVFLLGCGTAYYAALFGEYLFDLAGYDVESIVGSEFAKNQQLLLFRAVFMMLSQSGETIDVVEAVKLAKSKKMSIVCLTNVLGSSLYRQADIKILLGAGQEVAVATTKAFTAKLAILIQMAYWLKNDLKTGKNLISQAAKAVQTICSGQQRQQIKTLAQKLKDNEHMFVVGRLLSYPIALETALKIKEVSYIHAEGFPGGELKHGPIALIDKGTPCLVIAPNDQTYNDSISSAHEMKARGGLIIGISPKKDSVFDIHLPVPDLKEATAIAVVVISQLLAYDLAVARGLNPDKPRNLAKSVTVK